MVKASPIITAMNAGEWSSDLEGRTDLEGYTASAKTLENFIPTIQGPIVRRAGTGFIRAVRNSANPTRLIPFVKSRDDTVMLEFGNLYVRFYVDRSPVVSGSPLTITGVTSANPVVVTSAAHGLSNGADVFIDGVVGTTEVNGRWFMVANKTANTFELTTIHGDNVDGSAYTAYSSGGTIEVPYEIVSPYTSANLTNSRGELGLDFTQINDVMYIIDRTGVKAPRTLSRTSATSWAFDAFLPSDGPFDDMNADDTIGMRISAATGSITVTATNPIFRPDDVIRLIRIEQEIIDTDVWKASKSITAGDYIRSQGKEYLAITTGTTGTNVPQHVYGTVSDGGVEWQYTSPGYVVAVIAAYVDSTHVTATVLTTGPQTLIGAGNASTFWRFSPYTASLGYPDGVSFWRDRLCFSSDSRLDMSVAGAYSSFSPDSYGDVLPESAVSLIVPGRANKIAALQEGDTLAVLTSGGEVAVREQSTSDPFGPNNVRASGQTSYGARPIQPVRVGDVALYVTGSGTKVRAMQYSIERDSFVAPDQTVRASHIGVGGISRIVRQEDPHQTLWAVRGDGVLLSFAFDPDQQVRAWARHTISGTDAIVEDIAAIPSPDGTRDDVYLVVSRTINGGTYRYIEYLRPEYMDGDDQEDATYVDCGLTYDGSAATTLYGFDHLEGETVAAMADGAEISDVTVANGEVVLPASASVVQAGYRYASTYWSMRLDSGAADGTAQGKTKRITDCSFRVHNSRGGSAGPDSGNLDTIGGLNYRDPATLMGSPSPLVSGDVHMPWPGGYDTDGRIMYYNDTVFPAKLVAIMPQVKVEESR